jgi:AcrR family transcriptional regulator
VAVKERADAARNRQAILAAASTLFAAIDDPMTVTMDDVAAAAGVGKGTLFRRFGDRAGLLRAVFETRMTALTAARSGHAGARAHHRCPRRHRRVQTE